MGRQGRVAVAVGLAGLGGAGAVRCFFGPHIAFTAGDMITCNGAAGFRGFNLGSPDLYGKPHHDPVRIDMHLYNK